MIEELKGIVSSIETELETLKEFSSDLSFVQPIMPAFVGKPKDVEEVKNLVRWARDTKTPLVPVSSGKPHLRGDTVPTLGGSMIVDLSVMKEIRKIERRNRVALVEPGVTFEELIEALKKEGLRPNIPFLPKRSKSVVASILEREPPIMPKYHWDISDPLCCLEVIFGNGETFRTGEAAGPGSLEDQWRAGGVQKAPYGPGPMHWHRLIQAAQGTMGIVTWVSLRCELLPEKEEPFFVPSKDLSKLLELTHWIIRMRLVNECFILNNMNLALSLSKNLKDIKTQMSELPPFILFFNVAGYEYFPEERVESSLKTIEEIMKRIGLEAKKSLPRVSAMEFLRIIQAPCPEPYFKLRYKGGCYELFFITISEKIEYQIKKFFDLLGRYSYPASEVGIYIQPVVQGTNYHLEFDIFYDPQDEKEKEIVKSLSLDATLELLSTGAFFSRPYGHISRLIMNRNAAHVAALRKIKEIFDPAHIMNPGKLCF